MQQTLRGRDTWLTSEFLGRCTSGPFFKVNYLRYLRVIFAKIPRMGPIKRVQINLFVVEISLL